MSPHPEPDLSRLFIWAMPEEEGVKPRRVAEVGVLIRPLAIMGHRFAVEPPADDSEAERDRWASDYRRCVWAEYGGFDRDGLAQVMLGFRDTKGGEERVTALAEALRTAVKPWGFKVTVLRRFDRPERILLSG